MDANTRGGEELFIFGTNLGPAGDPFLPSVTYGDSSGRKYAATGCIVVNAFSKIKCTTSPGTGLGHSLVLTVGGQESEVYDAKISYGKPSVHFFDTEWEDNNREGASTPGGELVVVHGERAKRASYRRLHPFSTGTNKNYSSN